MALPAPSLDDRRFQDLVDEAKRMVQRQCPEWTDHNVSDPGVTLIETFAFMTDQLLYRLNRVPDRLYVKFLDLLGLRIFPPTPARVPLTFWLSTPAQSPLSIAAGTEAGTVRTEAAESTVFSLRDELTIVPCSVQYTRVRHAEGDPAENQEDQAERLASRGSFAAFADPPAVGDLLLVGLTAAVPGCAVRIDFAGTVAGVGVNPKHPPLVWEAWTGESWSECEVGLDETGGLNTSGSIELHVPPTHQVSIVDEDRAGWLRARVVDPLPGQRPYSATPVVRGLTASTVGATGVAINAEFVVDDVLGESEGTAGQIFPLSFKPVLAGIGQVVVEVSGEERWQTWGQVDHFGASDPDDRHFVLDAFAGEVTFGPVVRLPDGRARHYGAVPAKGATVRVRRYAIGGGSSGNVSAHTVQTLKSSVPFVASVENRRAAHGGVDGESLAQAKDRGRILLRTRDRAVTATDYEVLTREVAPDLARVRCLTAGEGDVGAGVVKVLVVPAAFSDNGRTAFADLVPSDEVLARIGARLDEARTIGTRVIVEPPRYRGVTVVARLVARPRAKVDRVRQEALDALYRYLDPLPGGGPDAAGWSFGRPVQAGALYGVLQQVRGVDMVEDVRLFAANPVTGERGAETNRIELEANSLVFSFEHKVRVETR